MFMAASSFPSPLAERVHQSSEARLRRVAESPDVATPHPPSLCEGTLLPQVEKEKLSYFRDRGDDPRDILRPRQTVIAILDHGQHHVFGGQPLRQRKRVPPRHIGILRALQDAYGTADLDGATEQQMVAALLDQRARDRIG